jgi:hypothetical protein
MVPFGLRTGNQRRPHCQSSADTDGTASGLEPEEFNPTLVDVLNVRHLLQWYLPRGLPEELVDMIVDAAEYWPSIEQRMQDQWIIQKDRDQVLLKTVPLCYDRNVYLSVRKLANGTYADNTLLFRAWKKNRIPPLYLIAEYTLVAR